MRFLRSLLGTACRAEPMHLAYPVHLRGRPGELLELRGTFGEPTPNTYVKFGRLPPISSGDPRCAWTAESIRVCAPLSVPANCQVLIGDGTSRGTVAFFSRMDNLMLLDGADALSNEFPTGRILPPGRGKPPLLYAEGLRRLAEGDLSGGHGALERFVLSLTPEHAVPCARDLLVACNQEHTAVLAALQSHFDPDDAVSAQALVVLLTLWSLGYTDACLKATEWTADHSGNLLFFLLHGWELLRLGQPQQAVAAFEEALIRDQSHHLAWVGKGAALSDLRENNQAAGALDHATELKPDSLAAWYNKGHALAILHLREEAVAAFRKALELAPDYYKAWRNLGGVLRSLGRIDESEDAYDHALQLRPRYYDGWVAKGYALRQGGRSADAVNAYQRASHLEPENPIPWYSMGNALTDLGRFSEALRAYDQAMQLQPDSYDILLKRSHVLLHLRKPDEALRGLRLAAQIAPCQHATYYLMAKALLMMEQRKAALGMLEQAVKRSEECCVRAGKDEAFAPLAGWERFRRLIAPPPQPAEQSSGVQP